MNRRGDVLELAILGLLQDSPMHGYEVRKRLNALLGWGRAFSYGTLYPRLKALVTAGLITEHTDPAPPRASRRGRIVYTLTSDGKEHLAALLGQAGPPAWEDERFGVHFAFFGQTDAAVRLRILEGRRTRLQERLDQFRSALQRTRERLDSYTLELQRHGLESVEREVRWLDQLIEAERRGTSATVGTERRGTSATVGTERRGTSATVGTERRGGEQGAAYNHHEGTTTA